MNCFLKLYVLTLLIHLNVAAYIIPEDVSTQIGGSYTVMLVNDDENIKAKQCYLTDTDNKIIYEINLTTPGVPLKPNTTASVEENTNILTSLGYGICGFKLDNFGNNYIRDWYIYVNEINKYFFRISIRDVILNNSTYYVPIGDSFSVHCDNNITSGSEIIKCELYNPQGVLIVAESGELSDCLHQIDSIKMSDYGVWKCKHYFKNNMYQKTVYKNIIEKDFVENVIINTWKNETNMQVKIGCSNNNINDKVYLCEMIRPDGEIFVLKEGLATDRYTALTTNIGKGICGMEIQKPLKEFEKGLWRCELKCLGGSPIGGFINLSNDSSSLPPPKIQKVIYTRVNQSISISCKVPYSFSYCYIHGPNGKIYPVEDNRGPTLGLCKFTKRHVAMKDNGTWYCGFARKTGEPDTVYSFDVKVSENLDVKPEKNYIKTTIGDTVRLKCSTEGLGDFSLQYCRFKSPQGQIYNINPEQTSDRINYYGRGLKYGDCGIELKNVQVRDHGTWTCITRIGTRFRYPEVYSNTYLVSN